MMNALDYLIRIEEDGLKLYRTLGEETDHPELKNMFNLLIDAQQDHVGYLTALKESVAENYANALTVERAMKLNNGFRRVLESHDIHAELKNDPDAFAHILKAEEDCIHLLEGMAHAERDGNARTLLERLSEEERRHLERLVSIGEFYETPRTYLEWGEFSNLHPL